jgi:hypothetical protein
MQNEGFEKLLIEAIDETLSSLGESPKQAILFHLENTFNIKEHEISNKIEAFDEALQKIFGPGATFLEKTIVNKLREKTDSIFKDSSPQDGFIVVIKTARHKMDE